MGKASKDKWLRKIAQAELRSKPEQAPDYGLWIGIVALAVGGIFFLLQTNGVGVNWPLSIIIYLICTSGIVWSTSVHVFSRRHSTKARFPVLALIVLTCGVISVIGVRKQYDKDTSLPLPTPDAKYITYYGPTGRAGDVWIDRKTGAVRSGIAINDVEVNGNLLTIYARTYYLIAVSFHFAGDEDPKDVIDLSTSGRVEISRGLILLRIPWNEHFRKEIGRFHDTAYALMLVPKDVDPSRIQSIRDATHLGGYLLEEATGPPSASN